MQRTSEVLGHPSQGLQAVPRSLAAGDFVKESHARKEQQVQLRRAVSLREAKVLHAATTACKGRRSMPAAPLNGESKGSGSSAAQAAKAAVVAAVV